MNTTQWTERVQEEAFVESIRLLYGEKAEEKSKKVLASSGKIKMALMKCNLSSYSTKTLL